MKKKESTGGTLPDWNAEDAVECNFHAYLNTLLIVSIGIFVVMYSSIHVDGTRLEPTVYSFIILSQKANTPTRYPAKGKSIGAIALERVVGFTVCCISKKKESSYCFEDIVLKSEQGEVFIDLDSPIDLDNLYCKTLVEVV